MRRFLIIVSLLLAYTSHIWAWGDRGHELVAYIAYMHLNPAVKKKVDALVAQNPCAKEWKTTVATLPASQRSVALFMLAATWPDMIKQANYDCQPNFKFDTKDGADGPTGHFSADVAPNIPAASQNIGYEDDRRHQYWHFIDTPIAEDSVTTEPPNNINVLTELQLLSQAMSSNESSSIKSYDLMWVEHLTGDIHQPLHDVQRFSSKFPNGDAGGNAVKICSSSGKCGSDLHAYWDELPGSNSSLSAVLAQGATLNQRKSPTIKTIDVHHPEHWVTSAASMAKSDAYASPFTPDEQQVQQSSVTARYHSKAMADMQAQIFLAGYRLMAILNDRLAE